MSGGLLAAFGGFLLLLGGACWALLGQIRREERLAARVRTARFGAAIAVRDADREPSAPILVRSVSALGRAIMGSGLLPAKTLAELEHTLTAAGFRGRNGLALFVGSKLLLVLCAPVLGWMLMGWLGFTGMMHHLGVGGAGVLGLLMPDWIVRSLRKRYLKRVDRGLPDALDMLVICAEAGLGLEPAVNRVGREIRAAHPDVSAEMLQTASELRIVADHRVALQHFSARTGIEGVKRLSTTLIQTLQYGTPLTDALRALSAELRQEQLTKFEARAARLPVLLTLPMIIFILPCVFLVVGGPAVIQVMRNFKG